MRSNTLKFLSAALLTIVLVACEDSIESPEKQPDTQPDLPKESYVKVLPSAEISFSSSASQCSLTIESSGEWEISGMSDWCNVSPESGHNGDKIVVAVTDNNSQEPRTLELTIICDEAETTIHVLQAKRKTTSYVDMEFEKSGTSTQYDPASGVLTITYADGKLPDVEAGSTIVLPSDYMFGIRVVNNVSNSGNTLTLETSQGNMCNLFKNTSFTLSTTGETRSSVTDGCPVITPVAIGYLDENGKYIEVYNQTKSDYTIQQTLWTFHKDYNDETLYSGGGGRIWWERCSFDSTLDAVFEFAFSDNAEEDEELTIGELQKFGYKLHGSYGADLLLRYHFDYKKTFEYEDIIKKDILKKKVFKFVVNGIPIVVTVSTHLGHYASLTAKGRVDVSGGIKADLNIDAGLSWSRANGVEPIYHSTSSTQIYHPTIETEASATMKMSTYPQIEIGLYDFIGPWVEPRPYVKEVMQAGARASTDGNSYIGWTDEFFWGVDMKFGLNLDFGIWNTSIDSKVYNTVKDRLFASSPSRISIYSPLEEDISIPEGQSLDIEFMVESHSPVTDNYWPCAEAAVLFETESGELSDFFELTDDKGIAKVTWTPKRINNEDIQKLKAKIVNSKGDVIDEIIFELKVFKPLTLNSISYKNDYYYYTYEGDGYIRYNFTADISGDTSLLQGFSSCGIYIYDTYDGKYYIFKDGLSGNYNNTEIDIKIDITIDSFNNIDYSRYYAESNRYYYGTFVQYIDGPPYLSEPLSCPLIYNRYPSYSFESVGRISVSKVGEQEDEDGNIIYKYKGSYPCKYKIDGALWIMSIQDICNGNDWVISETGTQYGKSWTPSGDYEGESSRTLNYWSTNQMYHILYNKITTTSGDNIYSNTLVFGGSPESPTVSISGTRSSATAESSIISQNIKGENISSEDMPCTLSVDNKNLHSEIREINKLESIGIN